MLLNCGVGEKTLESPLNYKEIQPVHSKGDQSWVFIGRTDVDAETPTLWPPDVKIWLIGKDPDAGKVLGQEEKGTTEDDIVGWHHWRDGHEFGWTLGVGDGQGGLACCGSWGCKESDSTEWLNWTQLKKVKHNKILLDLPISAYYGLSPTSICHLVSFPFAWRTCSDTSCSIGLTAILSAFICLKNECNEKWKW